MILLKDLKIIAKKFGIYLQGLTYSMALKHVIGNLEDHRRYWLNNYKEGECFSAMDIDFETYCGMKLKLTPEEFRLINTEANNKNISNEKNL